MVVNDLARCQSRAHSTAVVPGLAGRNLAVGVMLAAAGRQSVDTVVESAGIADIVADRATLLVDCVCTVE